MKKCEVRSRATLHSVAIPSFSPAEARVLEAADLSPELVDGLSELIEARRRTFLAERSLRDDLAALELARDQLDEKARRVKERRKDADKAQAQLTKLAHELGAVAFQAHYVGDLPDLSVFSGRAGAQDEVDRLEGEITELSEAKGFGAVVKAKARQAGLLAKVTALKASFRGLEREIGRQLVEERTEELVRCDATEVLLTKIQSQRHTVESLDGLLNEANAELMRAGREAAEEFALERVMSSKDLDPAEERIELGLEEAKKAQRAAGRKVLDRLDVAVSLGELDHDSDVWRALKELREDRAD